MATDPNHNNQQLKQKIDDNNMSDNNIVVHQNDIKNEPDENIFDDEQQDEINENKLVNDDGENVDDEEPLDDHYGENVDDEEPMDNHDYDQNEGDNLEHIPTNQIDPNIWTLPADKNVCTLEEIRRGQVINKVPPTMCPVLGCGKIINEAKAEPSPGTIASGLRTHVLFVHYATQHGRKVVKKRKALGWTNKKRNQTSPKKHLNQLIQTRFHPIEQSSTSTTATTNYDNDPLDLKQHQQTNDLLASLQKNMAAALNTPVSNAAAPGSLLDKKVRQMAANKSLQVLQMSSHQSLMQATGGNNSGPKHNSNLLQKQKNQTTNNNTSLPSSQTTNNFNSTTSSLFSILAGLTAQQQKNQINQQQQQPSLPRNIKTAHGTNTINISECSRNTSNNNNSNRPVNSSLLSLLNEKISGNVASSLQNQLKKSLSDQRGRLSSSTSRHVSPSPALNTNSSFYQSKNNNDSNTLNSNGTSLLSNFCNTGVGLNDDALSYDTSMPLNSFVETIAIRTGSNIGPSGVAEVKKFIEKFTTSLICSSQTIADHYIAPYGGEVTQQKPEISPSDVILAYKMMNKSQMQI